MYANLTTNPSISPSLAFNTGAGREGITRSHGIRDGDVVTCHHRDQYPREEARVIVITEMAAGLGAREIHFLGPFALPS